MDRDFRTYAMDRFDAIDPKELEGLLYPLLMANDRPTAPEMLRAVSPLLATVLDHKREAEYLEAMAAGHYRQELLSRAKPPSSNASSGIRHFSGKPIMSHGICRARRGIPNTRSPRPARIRGEK
jgi:hypothetical protein